MWNEAMLLKQSEYFEGDRRILSSGSLNSAKFILLCRNFCAADPRWTQVLSKDWSHDFRDAREKEQYTIPSVWNLGDDNCRVWVEWTSVIWWLYLFIPRNGLSETRVFSKYFLNILNIDTYQPWLIRLLDPQSNF